MIKTSDYALRPHGKPRSPVSTYTSHKHICLPGLGLASWMQGTGFRRQQDGASTFCTQRSDGSHWETSVSPTATPWPASSPTPRCQGSLNGFRNFLSGNGELMSQWLKWLAGSSQPRPSPVPPKQEHCIKEGCASSVVTPWLAVGAGPTSAVCVCYSVPSRILCTKVCI